MSCSPAVPAFAHWPATRATWKLASDGFTISFCRTRWSNSLSFLCSATSVLGGKCGLNVGSTDPSAGPHATVRVRYFSNDGSNASNFATDLARVSVSVFVAASDLACALSSTSLAAATTLSAASFAAGGVCAFFASATALVCATFAAFNAVSASSSAFVASGRPRKLTSAAILMTCAP